MDITYQHWLCPWCRGVEKGFCTRERTQRKGEERTQTGLVSVTKLHHRIVHEGLSFPIVAAPRFIKAQHVFTYFYPKLTEKALCICSIGEKKREKSLLIWQTLFKNLFLPRFVSLVLFVCLIGVCLFFFLILSMAL